MFSYIINTLSVWAIPLFILSIVFYGYYKKVKLYESFTEGSREGFTTAVAVIPY